MKCNHCGSENTELSGGCYCCYMCLDCDRSFVVGLMKIKPISIEYWEKIETINISADKTPFRLINSGEVIQLKEERINPDLLFEIVDAL